MSVKDKFIGDSKFYKRVMMIAVPIMIQNGITNFVSLLDNLMVGSLGTEQMSGAAIVNQLMFVVYLCFFGAMSGAGIFTAQYFGKKDNDGVRDTFRYKIWINLVITTMATCILLCGGELLINMYLKGESEGIDAVATLNYGMEYLRIILIGLPAFAVVQIYASTLRECGKTIVPMMAGILAVFVNLVLNYVLIFGNFGAPELGVAGAAIATVISRYVEMLFVVIWTHTRRKENEYIIGMYKTLKVPMTQVINITKKGLPLLVNETMWSVGVALVAMCYSIRGLSVVPAHNISNTVSSLFNVVFLAMGDAVAIMVGQLLGANKMKEARDEDNKLIAFAVMCALGMGTLMFIVAPLIPELYNTDVQTKELAKHFLMLCAVFMPQNAFLHATYFTLRSGGKTIVTFLFDSVFICCVSVPVAFALSSFTNINIVWVFALVQMADWIKCIIGFVLVKKGVWMNNIVSNE